jgi:integrase
VARVYDPLTRGQRHLGTFDTKGLAQEAERRALESRRRGGFRDERVEEFVARWTTDYPRPRESTNVFNAERVKSFGEDFKGRTLRSIGRQEAREWALLNKGKLGPVRAMFSDAAADGLCDINPFANLRIPRSRGRKDIVPITTVQLDRLVEKAGEVWEKDDWGLNVFGPMILVAAYTGIRPGEMFALKWADVDIEGKRLWVRAAVDRTGRITRPKNDEHRQIALPPPAGEALKRVPKEVLEDGRVFFSGRGAPFVQPRLHYYWGPVKAAAGLANMDFYELRHFCGSYLASRGVSPRQIAKQLGHQDGGRLAMSLYIHSYHDEDLDGILKAFE